MTSRAKVGSLGLRIFLALVGVNAAIGIGVLVAGGLGATGGRILLTSLSLTTAVMLGLACSTGRATASLRQVWLAGVAAAGAGCVLMIVGLWSETENTTFWKATGTLVSVCVAVALVSLAGLPALPDRVRWTFAVAVLLTAVLWGMVVIGMWGEVDSSWFWRLFGAVAVALAAFVLVIPVLARARSQYPEREEGATASHVGFCPSCGRPLVRASGEVIHCPDCDATFTVRFADRAGPSVPRHADRSAPR